MSGINLSLTRGDVSPGPGWSLVRDYNGMFLWVNVTAPASPDNDPEETN